MTHSIRCALRASVVLLLHTGISVLTILCTKIIEVTWSLLFPQQEPLVAGILPLRYLIDVGDACVIVIFLGFGCLEAVKAFRSPEPLAPPSRNLTPDRAELGASPSAIENSSQEIA